MKHFFAVTFILAICGVVSSISALAGLTVHAPATTVQDTVPIPLNPIAKTDISLDYVATEASFTTNEQAWMEHRLQNDIHNKVTWSSAGLDIETDEVPEPATMFLFGAGLLGLASMLAFKQKLSLDNG
ncbi:MAG: hypothetical protein COA36_10095 [Desulfotalea sp.]|nr:MAG: hypothetical protein COA36_10095 [Desulfotalea sp.]